MGAKTGVLVEDLGEAASAPDPRRKFYDDIKNRARSNMAEEMRKSVAPPTPPEPVPTPAPAPPAVEPELTAEEIVAALEAMNQPGAIQPPPPDVPLESGVEAPPVEGVQVASGRPLGGDPGEGGVTTDPTVAQAPEEDDEEALLRLALEA